MDNYRKTKPVVLVLTAIMAMVYIISPIVNAFIPTFKIEVPEHFWTLALVIIPSIVTDYRNSKKK